MVKKRYRRSKKTSPLQEIGFVALFVIGALMVSFQQYASNYDVGMIIGSI